MYKRMILFFLLISFKTFAQEELPLAYLQNFDGKSTNYSTDGSDDNLISLQGGRYHVDRKKSDEATSYYWGNPMISFERDYNIEALMRHEGGADTMATGSLLRPRTLITVTRLKFPRMVTSMCLLIKRGIS